MNKFEQPASVKPSIDPSLSWSETLGESLPTELPARSAPSAENLERAALLAKWKAKKGPLGLGAAGDQTEKGVQKRRREMDADIASIELPQASETSPSNLPSFAETSDTEAVSDIRRKLDEHPDTTEHLPGQQAA